MDNYQKRVVAAMRRGLWFLAKHYGLIGQETVGRANTELEAAIAGILDDSRQKVQYETLAQSGTVTKYDIRRHLRAELSPVVSIAQSRLLALPEADLAKFQLPHGHASDVSLILAARAMADAAAEFRPAFQQYGRPADFIESLQGLADELEGKIVTRDGNRINRRRAQLGVAVKLADARVRLRIISAAVTAKLRQQPDLVGAWRTAIRIGGHTASVPDDQPSETPSPTGPVLVVDSAKAA